MFSGEKGTFKCSLKLHLFSIAYMCHHNSFLLYDSMKVPTPTNWSKVTHASVVVALILFLMLGIGGYTTFTGHSQGEAINECDFFFQKEQRNKFSLEFPAIFRFFFVEFESR